MVILRGRILKKPGLEDPGCPTHDTYAGGQVMSKSSDLYPKRRVTTREFAGVYLNKDPELITYADIEIVKNYLNTCINIENLSPKQIADKHNFVVGDLGWIIKTHFDIKLKDHKTAQKNTAIQKGVALTDAKYLYYKECEFNLSKQEMTQIPGFDHLIKRGSTTQ